MLALLLTARCFGRAMTGLRERIMDGWMDVRMDDNTRPHRNVPCFAGTESRGRLSNISTKLLDITGRWHLSRGFGFRYGARTNNKSLTHLKLQDLVPTPLHILTGVDGGVGK